MPKKFLKRYLPEHRVFREHNRLRHFSARLHDPNIWHLNRRSVSWGMAVGTFLAFLPMFGQMFLAAAAAIYLRVNLPLTVACVWITNPFTAAPIFYFNYRVGTWILGEPSAAFELQLSLEWLVDELSEIWQPLLLGCVVVGLIGAHLAFGLVRLAWRVHVIGQWQRRHNGRVEGAFTHKR